MVLAGSAGDREISLRRPLRGEGAEADDVLEDDLGVGDHLVAKDAPLAGVLGLRDLAVAEDLVEVLDRGALHFRAREVRS